MESTIPVLLVTANVGSIFEDVSIFILYLMFLKFIYFLANWYAENMD